MFKTLFRLLIVFLFLSASFSAFCYAGTSESEEDNIAAESELFAASEDQMPGDSPAGESSDGEGVPAFIAAEVTASECITENGYEYLLYDSGQMKNDNKTCILLIPSGTGPDEFMEMTEWDLASSMTGFQMICISCAWQDSPSEAQDYFEEVWLDYTAGNSVEDREIFLVGYEDGADFAAKEASRNTERYTGLVTFGGEGIPLEEIEELEEQENRSPLSVWIIASKKTSVLTGNLAYWKQTNRITDSALRSYSTTFADECYLPRTSTAGKITDDSDVMGMVLFSRSSDYYEHTMTVSVARNFIDMVHKNEISFRDEITGGEVVGISDWHFTYTRMQMDGQQRDYWTYVPDSVLFGNESCSLVLCLHGNGGNGEDMIFRSMWHESAEEENCVIVYPSSLYKTGYQHYWQNIEEEMTFLETLVEIMEEKYPVDRSRVYVTGFSNGAGMAQNLAIHSADIFAAAALSAPAYYDEEYFGPVDTVSAVAILFSYGSEDPYLEEYEMTAEIDDFPAFSHLSYWRMLYGFRQDFYKCEQEGFFTTYTFSNYENIPVCQWIIVEGKKHTYPKEEVSLYLDFMKCYTKAEDGTLYYYDEPVLIRSE